MIDHVKNLATILGTAATVAYISGYLVLRARANALGTDPGFTLVDEAYVFAGFRFVFVTLVVALCLSPVFLGIHFLRQWLGGHLSSFWLSLGQWFLLIVLAMVALASLKILAIKGLLLDPGALQPNTKLMGAVMGTQTAYGVLFTFGLVFVTMVSVYWLKARFSSPPDPLTWGLYLVLALFVFILPIYHGALFADRKVRVLADVPKAVKNMVEPIGIVDHTKDHKTLFGNDSKGLPSLTIVKHDDLYGHSVQAVISLRQFVNRLATQRIALASPSSVENNLERQMATTVSDGVKGAQKSFFKALIDQLHMAFESIGSLGNSVVQAGQLWSVRIDDAGQASQPKRLGKLNHLAWPVMHPDGKTVYALQEGVVVKLTDDFQATEMVNAEGYWIKLLGVTTDGTLMGLIYADNQAKLARVDGTGKLQVLPESDLPEDQSNLARLLQESRPIRMTGCWLSTGRSAVAVGLMSISNAAITPSTSAIAGMTVAARPRSPMIFGRSCLFGSRVFKNTAGIDRGARNHLKSQIITHMSGFPTIAECFPLQNPPYRGQYGVCLDMGKMAIPLAKTFSVS